MKPRYGYGPGGGRGPAAAPRLLCIVMSLIMLCLHGVCFANAETITTSPTAAAVFGSGADAGTGSVSDFQGNNNNYKIAFMFLTRGPMPLEPIWDAFFHWNADPSLYNIYVHPHNDYFYSNDSLFYGHEVRTPGVTQWGALSVTGAIQAMVARALEDPLNMWFTLMSEACIPLHPFSMWRRALAESSLSVVNACPHDDDRAKSEDMTEIVARWRPELADAGVKREEWRKTATWFALNRKHAQIFADDKKVLNAFVHVPIPDEHYIGTLLAHHGLDNETACSDGFMHHLFTPTGSHPKTYGPHEIDAGLFKTLDTAQGKRGFGLTCSGRKTLCHFTARKFGPQALFALTMTLNVILSDDSKNFSGVNPLQSRLRRVNSTNSYYLLMHGELMWVPFVELNDRLGFVNDAAHIIPELTDTEFAGYPQMASPFPHVKNGEICKTRHNPQVFLIMNYVRHGIDSMQVFETLSLSFANLRLLSDSELGILPAGEEITMATVGPWKEKLKAGSNDGQPNKN
jgi:hypothetical protein